MTLIMPIANDNKHVMERPNRFRRVFAFISNKFLCNSQEGRQVPVADAVDAPMVCRKTVLCQSNKHRGQNRVFILLPVERGWCLGGEEFRRELLEQVNQLAGPRDAGEEVRQAAEAKAEGIVQAELKRLGWEEKELEERRKGDPAKVRVAARLRRETTMTLAWIAERLRMGTPGHLAHLLYWRGRND